MIEWALEADSHQNRRDTTIAVTVGTGYYGWDAERLDMPLLHHGSPRIFYPRGSKQRVRFVADQRNIAVEKALAIYPDTTDILMIDSYYTGQTRMIDLLVNQYFSMKEQCVLGGSTWSRYRGKLTFWDKFLTPECASLEYGTLTGIHPVSGLGACYLFPRSAWDKGARYGVPDYGGDHLPFHRAHNLPLYMSFDVRLWHPPLVDVNSPLAVRFKSALKTVRVNANLSHLLPYFYRERLIWYTLGEGTMSGPRDYEKWLRKFVTFKGRQFVDIGANIGMYSVRAAKTFSQVVAFEPGYDASRVLLKNIRLNRLKNVKVYKCALAAVDGSIDLNIYQATGWSSLYPPTESPYSLRDIEKRILKRVEKVPVRRLDDFDLDPSLVKIDTEGAEAVILEGGLKTIRRSRPELLIEAHSFESKEKCLKILNTENYDCWVPMTPLPEHIIARPGSISFRCRMERYVAETDVDR